MFTLDIVINPFTAKLADPFANVGTEFVTKVPANVLSTEKEIALLLATTVVNPFGDDRRDAVRVFKAQDAVSW